jgi:DNA primase catalytic core
MDAVPSAGLIPNSNRVFCFSCKLSYDLLDICYWVEGKPSSGTLWLSDTLPYLCSKFGIDFQAPELSPQDLAEIEILSAYNHAFQTIRHLRTEVLSQTVQDKLKVYNWGQKFLYKLGIGSVISYKDYITKMTVEYGHDLAFLKVHDLANSYIFNEHNIIYTIRDINGNPVGFSARNLNYEQELSEYKSESEKSAPNKYIHTRETGTLFSKKNLLFNFDFARKSEGPITVVEGNADCVTLYVGGELGTVSTLGTAFTKEHLDLLLEAGKKHIIVALDNDKAGKAGVERVINLVNNVSGQIGLRLEVVCLPSGIKDPDEFVRTHSGSSLEEGVKDWRKLDKLDIFSWSLNSRMSSGGDPIKICEETIPLIINEVSNLVRMRKAKQLAKVTGLSEAFIEKEVLRLVDGNNSKIKEEENVIREDLIKKLRNDPSNFHSSLNFSVNKLEKLHHQSVGYNPESVIKNLDLVFEDKEKRSDALELITGFPIFDEAFGGIPRYGCLMTFPGKPHHAKSNFVDNLVLGLLKNNPDLMVLFHTVDDSINDRLNRLLGAKTGMISDVFRRPKFYLDTKEGQAIAPECCHDRYYAAKSWIRSLHEEERLILADVSILPPDVHCLKSLVSGLRLKFPERPMIIVGDNFHLYSIHSNEIGEGYVRAVSKCIKDEIVSELKTTALFTMELPKEQFKPGIKPAYTNLKGSAGLSFDAKVNCGVYNQLQDWVGDPSKVSIWWESPKFLETSSNSDGITTEVPIKKPIIEVIVDKNKVNGVVKTIFFKLENLSGAMAECSVEEQSVHKNSLIIQQTKELEALTSSKAAYKSRM